MPASTSVPIRFTRVDVWAIHRRRSDFYALYNIWSAVKVVKLEIVTDEIVTSTDPKMRLSILRSRNFHPFSLALSTLKHTPILVLQIRSLMIRETILEWKYFCKLK